MEYKYFYLYLNFLANQEVVNALKNKALKPLDRCLLFHIASFNTFYGSMENLSVVFGVSQKTIYRSMKKIENLFEKKKGKKTYSYRLKKEFQQIYKACVKEKENYYKINLLCDFHQRSPLKILVNSILQIEENITQKKLAEITGSEKKSISKVVQNLKNELFIYSDKKEETKSNFDEMKSNFTQTKGRFF